MVIIQTVKANEMIGFPLYSFHEDYLQLNDHIDGYNMIIIHKLLATQTKHNKTAELRENKTKTGKNIYLTNYKRTGHSINAPDSVELANEFD